MSISISIADPSSYETLGSIFNAAFSTSLLHRTIFKACSPATTIEHAAAVLAAQTNAVIVCARLGGDEGLIVGYATWKLPLSLEEIATAPAVKKRIPWPEGTDVDLAEALFVTSGGLKIEGPHYYLSTLAVDPAYQKRRIGAALLQFGVDQADEGGLETHLKSSIEGLSLYKKFGFLPYGEKNVQHVNDTEIVLFPMCRPPAPSTTSRPPVSVFHLHKDLPPPLLDQHLKTFSDLHFSAFYPGEMFQSLFADVKKEDFVDLGSRRFRKVLESNGHGARILMASVGEKTVGVAYWTLPKKVETKPKVSEESGKKKSGREFAAGANVHIAREFFERVDAHYEDHSLPPHYGLQILATAPDAQRSGAGSALLKWGIEKADKEGVEVRLDATTEGLTFYPKFGFERCGEPLEASDASFRVYPMVRKAKKKPSISILPLTNVSSEVAHTYGALFASIHYSAFSPLEMHQSIFRNVAKEDFIALGTKRFTKLIETSEEKGVVVLMAFKDDEPLGVAYWTLPKAQIVGGTGEDPPSVRPFAPGTKEEIASDFFLRLDAHCADRSHPPHYELNVLVTSAAAQRTGAGTALLNWGIERAEKEGIDVRLESTKEGLTFYEKFGFKKSGEPLSAKDNSFAFYPMFRTPSTA